MMMQLRSLQGPVVESVSPVRRPPHRDETGTQAPTAGGYDPLSHQLVWPARGTVHLRTARESMLARRPAAIWVPARQRFEVGGTDDIWTARFPAANCPTTWNRLTHLQLDDFVFAALRHLDRHRAHPWGPHVASAIVEHLREAFAATPMPLPFPLDERAREIAQALSVDPAITWDLARWAEEIGSSERTLRRLFREETGLSFQQWRSRLRMQVALGLLEDGRPIEVVARSCGYRSRAAFARAFKLETGYSPTEYRSSATAEDGARLDWPDLVGERPPELRLVGEAPTTRDEPRPTPRGADVKRTLAQVPILLAAALMVAACGDDAGEATATPTTDPTATAEVEATRGPVQATATDTAEPTEAGPAVTLNDSYQVTGFPEFTPAPTMLELVEDRGDTLVVRHQFGEVEIPKDAQRIYVDASMLPTAIALDLNWIGAQHYADMTRLPGWEQDIAGAEFVQEVISYDFPFEDVALLEPDLILAYGNVNWSALGPDEAYDRASQVAPTLVPMGDPTAYFQTLTQQLGIALGQDPATVEASVTTQTEALVTACAPLREAIGSDTVAYIGLSGTQPQLQGIGWTEEGIYRPQADARWLYGFCDFEPAANLFELVGTDWGIDISLELLPTIEAEHIFLTTYGYTAEQRAESREFLEELLDDPIWQAVPAVRNGNVYLMDYFSAYSFDTASAAINAAVEALEAAG